MKASGKQTVVAIFVRNPVPGRVKTRLALNLGDEAACSLYRAMVEDSIATVTACGLTLFLFHDGQDEAGLPPEWIAVADAVFSQEGDSLGERMTAAFEQSFAVGATGVILIGSDIPGIDEGLLRDAADYVEGHDAVFAPAVDGGYCLVASRKDCFSRKIFQGIPWSSSQVLDMTIAACKEYGVSYHLLDHRQDIDTISDLSVYCRFPSSSAPATNAWLVSRGLLEPL
jgi:rSAM/selenodomain-associated transferase 1